jgi:murein DD-endopeptidase MepM/ murein hydrolase activator NlpD
VPVAADGDPPDALTAPGEAVGDERSAAQEPVSAGGAALPQAPSTEPASISEGAGVGIVVDGVFVPIIPSLAPPAAALDAATATGQWVWPVRGKISQDYSSEHRAVDIATDHGAVVVAADAGTVVYARWESSGYGYLVIIDHRNGFVSYYAHLYGFYIDAGRDVARGEQIGELGSTGRSTGPHLHFEIRQNGVQRNPLDLLP